MIYYIRSKPVLVDSYLPCTNNYPYPGARPSYPSHGAPSGPAWSSLLQCSAHTLSPCPSIHNSPGHTARPPPGSWWQPTPLAAAASTAGQGAFPQPNSGSWRWALLTHIQVSPGVGTKEGANTQIVWKRFNERDCGDQAQGLARQTYTWPALSYL